MKKLLITTLAAVSVGLCAKAEDTSTFTENGTSFDEEELTVGEAFNPTDTYWTLPTDTDDVFKITNVTYSADATKQHWDLTTGEKALSIDTANPILRNVNPEPSENTTNPPQGVTTPVFFDSVVQFTATDVAPSMENNTTDKLAVWLYQSPEDVSDTNPGLFNETTAKKTLVITAGVLERVSDGDNVVEDVKQKNYDTGIEIEPESWHRLTIKSFLNEKKDKLMFNVWIDGAKDPITAEGVTDFLSLVNPNVESDIKLQGVAFDGKGAVDDIVFTTTDPFAVPSYEITVKLSDDDQVSDGYYKAYSINGGNDFITLADTVAGDGVKLTLPTTVETILFKLDVVDDYKIDGATASRGEKTDDGYYWTKPVALADIIENGVGEISLAIVADDGTEDPITTYTVSVTPNAQATVGGLSAKYAEGNVVTFTVVAATGYTIEGVAVAGATTAPVLTVNGDGYSFTMPAEAVTITVTTKAIEEEVTYPSVGGVETPKYSDNAKAAIDAAFPENRYPTGGLTVKVNGETLTGDPAVAMLNDAVEMFTLAGDAKFFDEDGVMDISFKATNPLMETETAEATDYEAKVGEATATVTSNYTVNKETVDLTPGVAGENEAVTFKLVIKPAGSTGSDAGSAVQE